MELCFKQLALPGEAFIWDQHNIVYLHNGISGGTGGPEKKQTNRKKKHRIKGNLHDKFITKTKFTFFI